MKAFRHLLLASVVGIIGCSEKTQESIDNDSCDPFTQTISQKKAVQIAFTKMKTNQYDVKKYTPCFSNRKEEDQPLIHMCYGKGKDSKCLLVRVKIQTEEVQVLGEQGGS